MDRNEQQPSIPPAGSPESASPEGDRTVTGGWSTTGDLFDSPVSSYGAPATAEDFLSSIGLGQAVEGDIAADSDFGPEGREQPPAVLPSKPDVSPRQPHAASHREQPVNTEADTPPEAENAAEITQRVEATGTLGADSALARENPPLIALEDDDFGDISVLSRPIKREPTVATEKPSEHSREAGKEDLPGSVARRRPDTRPRWQRPIEED